MGTIRVQNEPNVETLVCICEMYEHHESHESGMHLGSVLIGIAAGIAGTILYATYKEREFNRIVGKTRELSDKSGQYLGNVGETVKSKAVAMVDSAQHAVDSLGEKVKRAAGETGSKMSDTTSSNAL